MRIIALVIVLGIGLLAWYHFPEPPPDPAATATVPAPDPELPVVASATPALGATEPQFVYDETLCDEFRLSPHWSYMQRAYPGMSDAQLCDYLQAPHISKLQGIEINPDALGELLDGIMAANAAHGDYGHVPDLRYYLDPQAVAAMHGLNQAQLVDKVNNERSAEAAYWLAQHYHRDPQTYTMLMLTAASYSKKPGLILHAMNGCCSWTTGNAQEQRAATIKREALSMIAKELELPEAKQWPDVSSTDEMTAEVLEQRAAYVAEINEYSIEAHGEAWIK